MFYATFGISKKSLDRSVRKGQGHAADKPGAPLLIRDLFKFNEELFVVSDIIAAAGVAGIPG